MERKQKQEIPIQKIKLMDDPWNHSLNPITMMPTYTRPTTKEQRIYWNELRRERKAKKRN